VRIYLVRHAEAEQGEPDELRALTARGRTAASELGRTLADEGVRLDAVLTSPLLRARQTGAALASPAGAGVEPDERLAPGATAEDVLAAVAGHGETVAVVGHQPDCGHIAAALGDGSEPAFPPLGWTVIDVPT
jgi:phosphohistidine phosphatase